MANAKVPPTTGDGDGIVRHHCLHRHILRDLDHHHQGVRTLEKGNRGVIVAKEVEDADLDLPAEVAVIAAVAVAAVIDRLRGTAKGQRKAKGPKREVIRRKVKRRKRAVAGDEAEVEATALAEKRRSRPKSTVIGPKGQNPNLLRNRMILHRPRRRTDQM